MTDITDDERQRIIDALYAGRKIEAIKIYRQANNCDLLAAKTFIEQLETRLRAETPESFTSAPSKGCSGRAALIVFVIAALLGGGWAVCRALTPRQLGDGRSTSVRRRPAASLTNASELLAILLVMLNSDKSVAVSFASR